MQTTNLKHLIYCLIVGSAIYGGAGTNIAKALSSTTTQTITITVPPIRALYVDEEETIAAIFSNIPVIADEKLQVFKDGAEIPVSDEIRCQYKKLLPTVNWSKLGWVYQRLDSETELLKRTQLEKETAGEIYSDLERAVYKEIAKEISACPERIFGKEQELSSSPHKVNYVVRATVYDTDEGLTGISVEFL